MDTISFSERYINLWRGDFADHYKAYPKLYRALVENDIYVCEDSEILKIAFYVRYPIQKEWIELKVYNDFIVTLKELTCFEIIDLEILSGDDLPF